MGGESDIATPPSSVITSFHYNDHFSLLSLVHYRVITYRVVVSKEGFSIKIRQDPDLPQLHGGDGKQLATPTYVSKKPNLIK